MDKIFRKLYLHEIAFNLIHKSFIAKSIKYQGVEQIMKHDFEMSLPSCRMCYTIMVHFIGVPITDPLRFYPFVQNHC